MGNESKNQKISIIDSILKNFGVDDELEKVKVARLFILGLVTTFCMVSYLWILLKLAHQFILKKLNEMPTKNKQLKESYEMLFNGYYNNKNVLSENKKKLNSSAAVNTKNKAICESKQAIVNRYNKSVIKQNHLKRKRMKMSEASNDSKPSRRIKSVTFGEPKPEILSNESNHTTETK